jgi:hypothetical protein
MNFIYGWDPHRALEDRPAGNRLVTLLEWAVARGCFMSARAKSPTFGLQGRAGTRFFTIFGNDGTLLLVLEPKALP